MRHTSIHGGAAPRHLHIIGPDMSVLAVKESVPHATRAADRLARRWQIDLAVWGSDQKFRPGSILPVEDGVCLTETRTRRHN